MNRRTLAVAAILSIACTVAISAQNSSDSTGFTRRAEVRAGFLSSPVNRAISGAVGPVSVSSASLAGGEFWALDAGGSGIMVRYATGTLDGPTTAESSGKLEYVDGRLLLGQRAFSLVLGYTLRTSRYLGKDRRFSVPRAGVQAGYHFAGSGVMLRGAGSYVRTVKKSESDSLEADGLEGETAILYVPPRLPFYIELGYRRELWNLTKESVVARREEIGGVMLSVGLQYGLSTR